MNRDFQNPNNVGNGEAEETLRLIAQLPAPEGLEGRIHYKLRAASPEARVLAWPLPASTGREWMRAAAAAAIAFVIAGGGWGVYSRVQPRTAGPMMLAPHGTPGGFAGANAVRTPQTINGPVLTGPVAMSPAGANSPIVSAQAPTPANAAKKDAATTKKAGATAPQAAAAQK
jgi:hypothetical protein